MMKRTICLLCVLIFILASQSVFGAPIDFDNMNVASQAFGFAGYEGRSNWMAAYKNKIYFILIEDGGANPSKVCCYDPYDGLSNTTNHSIIAETSGNFYKIKKINDLLYFSDTLGGVYTYDGTTLTEITGTPFSSNEWVSEFEAFGGLMYYGTSNSNVYRYNDSIFEQVYTPNEPRQRIMAMNTWPKDGYLYVSIGPVRYCCPPLGYVIRSNSGDLSSWDTIFQGFYYVGSFTPTLDYLYATVVDTSGSYSSTVRKSSDPSDAVEPFPIIHQSSGQYKTFTGSLFYDGIAYFFTNQWGGGYGYKIIDENGTVSLVSNQNWTVTHAVELNGDIYAMASSAPFTHDGQYVPADVYLITTSQGPPNQPPVLTSIGNKTVKEGQLLEFQISATDPDPNDVLTFNADNLPEGATFDPETATFSWTPGYDQAGVYKNIEFIVSDDNADPGVDNELITITVDNDNRPPEFDPIDAKTVNENETLQFIVTASDPDGDTIELSTGELPTGASFDPATGIFSWTPDNTQAGNYVVAFYAIDNGELPMEGELEVAISVGDVPTPIEAINQLIKDVRGMDIKKCQKIMYIVKLKLAKRFIKRGRVWLACFSLNHFIDMVEFDMNHDRISQEDGQKLIDGANYILTQLQ